MKNKTKSVSHVVLRDNVLEQIKHAELYKTLRDILTKKYKVQENKTERGVLYALSVLRRRGYKGYRLALSGRKKEAPPLLHKMRQKIQYL